MAEQTSPASLHKLIFDTDALIWYLRGYEKARSFIEEVPHERRALSLFTLMELLQGCRNQHEASDVKAFIAENISLVVHPDEIISRRAIFVRTACVLSRPSRRGRNHGCDGF